MARTTEALGVGFRVFIEIKIFMDSHSASKRVACLRHILVPFQRVSCKSKLRFIVRSLYNQAEPEFLWGGELQ